MYESDLRWLTTQPKYICTETHRVTHLLMSTVVLSRLSVPVFHCLRQQFISLHYVLVQKIHLWVHANMNHSTTAYTFLNVLRRQKLSE